MFYVWMTVLVLFNAGCWCLNLIGLPGNWLMTAATALAAWWQWDGGKSAWDQAISVQTLIAIVVLAIAGEVVELATGMAGSKIAGGSRLGCVGGLVGSVVGGIAGTFLIPIPLVGSLVGACVGAFAGTWLLEAAAGRAPRESAAIGAAAGGGRLVGTVVKLAIGVAIWAIVTAAAYYP